MFRSPLSALAQVPTPPSPFDLIPVVQSPYFHFSKDFWALTMCQPLDTVVDTAIQSTVSLQIYIPDMIIDMINKGPSSQGYGFSSGHVWMWELDCEESWAPKNWCFWTVVLEKTLESPLNCKEIQPVHPKGDQSSVLIGRTDAEAETPILWPPHAKSWLIGKDPDAGRNWRQEEKGMTEDEMAGWHHWLDGHEFE